MNKTIKIVSIGLVLVGIFFAFKVSHVSTPTVSQFGSANAPSILKTATNTNVSVLTSSTTILANRTSRSHAVIVNDGTNVVYLSLGATAVANKGIRLNPSGGSYEINEQNLFIGEINGIAVGGTSNVTVLEE